jgi:hypothetical protein
LDLGKWPCQYNAFLLADHIVGRINAILLIGRCIFWEALGIKMRHVLRLVYRIAYWKIQIKIIATGVTTRDFLKHVHVHRVAILLAWNIFITSMLVLIIAFLVIP